MDRVVAHLSDKEQEREKICELKFFMILHFGTSLTYGCEYIYQTVPRMLSIWLDMGEAQGPFEGKYIPRINKKIGI